MSGIENPVEEYLASVYHALHKGMPMMEYEWRGKMHHRRPELRDLSILSWPQMWGSTCLAFDANPNTIAGAACTTAVTVLIGLSGGTITLVYVGGRPAYCIDARKITTEQRTAFQNDAMNNVILGQRRAIDRYGAILPEEDQ